MFGGSLTLRNDGQVAEALAMVRALNKMTKAGMPEKVYVSAESRSCYRKLALNLIYSNKAELHDKVIGHYLNIKHYQ